MSETSIKNKSMENEKMMIYFVFVRFLLQRSLKKDKNIYKIFICLKHYKKYYLKNNHTFY